MGTSELTKEQLKLREDNLYICPFCKDVKSVNDAYFYKKESFVHTHDTHFFAEVTRHYDTSTYLIRLCEPCFRKQVRKSKIEWFLLIFFVAFVTVLVAVLSYILFNEIAALSKVIIMMLFLAAMSGWITYYIIGYLYKLIHYFSDKKFKFEKNYCNNAIENIHGVDKSRVYEPKLVSVKKI